MQDDLLVKAYGDALQRQMEQDIGDMCTEMSTKNSHTRNIKVQPAYEHVDVFKRQQFESNMRIRNNVDVAAKGRLIQPDDPSKPKVRVILPND